ncbi:MAG: hypothetical protein ACK2VA_07180 [Anaerolineae bacterium]
MNRLLRTSSWWTGYYERVGGEPAAGDELVWGVAENAVAGV